MTIRPGAIDDIPAVLPLVASTIAFHEQMDPARFGAVPEAYRRYEGWMQRTAGSTEGAFFVAEERGRVVALSSGRSRRSTRCIGPGATG